MAKRHWFANTSEVRRAHATVGMCLLGALLSTTASGQGPGPGPGKVAVPPETARELGGFRMEGAADVDVVFGDAAQYRAHIDRFYVHHAAMIEGRATFAAATHSSLGVLSRVKRGCPSDELAVLYARAQASLDNYRDTGALLEAEHLAIARLDDYGETAALTPDYRFKVAGARGIYQAALIEYREMRIAFEQELGSELRYRRCDPKALLAAGTANQVASLLSPASVPLGPETGKTRPKRDEDDGPAPERTRATFFIDNRGCKLPVVLHLDGAIAGRIEGGNRGVFQASTGRHVMCLMREDDPSPCGTIGTLRTAYLHNGFSFAMNCVDALAQPKHPANTLPPSPPQSPSPQSPPPSP